MTLVLSAYDQATGISVISSEAKDKKSPDKNAYVKVSVTGSPIVGYQQEKLASE